MGVCRWFDGVVVEEVVGFPVSYCPPTCFS